MFVLFYVFSNIFVFQYSFSRGVESYHSAIHLSIHGSNKDFPTNYMKAPGLDQVAKTTLQPLYSVNMFLLIYNGNYITEKINLIYKFILSSDH